LKDLKNVDFDDGESDNVVKTPTTSLQKQ